MLASRFVYSMQTAGAPFWAQSTLGGTDKDLDALGGDYTLHGYRNMRFIGPVMAMANVGFSLANALSRSHTETAA